MAYTMKVEKVVAAHLGGTDTSGNGNASAGMKFVGGIIDITDTATNGVVVPASEFGLSKIFGVVATSAQSGVGDNNFHIITPATDEKSVTWIVVGDDGTPEDSSDAGEIAYVAFGEGL